MESKITIAEITDREIWEKFINQYGSWSLFQGFTWGEVQKALGQKILRLGMYEKNELVGVAQLFIVRAKRGTFLHIRQGPVFKQQHPVYWEALLKYLRQMAQREVAWFIRVNPMIEDSLTHRGLLKQFGFQPAPIHAMDAEVCWVLDLDKSEAELLANMRKTTRYLIRQAEKMDLIIKESSNIKPFMQLYDETTKRQRFVGHRGIEEEYAIFSRQKQVILLTVEHQGEVLSGALILLFGTQAIYHHGASLTSKIPASYLLQWRAIIEAKKRGLKLYNFWGIAPDASGKHPWAGITLFKRGFGGKELRFLHAHDLALSPFYALSYTIEKMRKIRKGY